MKEIEHPFKSKSNLCGEIQMKIYSLFVFGALTTFMAFPAAGADGSLRIRELRCEYQHHPLAVDVVRPRVSWILESSQRNQRQTAYQVLVASSHENLDKNLGDLWDSGQVTSDRSIQVEYAGKPLASYQNCFWKVRVWDANGQSSPWSEPAAWSMGILQDDEWNARWLCFPQSETNPDQPASLPIFRRGFSIDKEIKQARVYVCGLGFYELRLNGEKVGDALFDPGWTNYRKTCLYSTYDVTTQLRAGENALGVMLGNGMYNVTGGRYVKFTGSFGPPKFILKLRIEYTDGQVTEIVSDESWCCHTGPIVFSCIYGGEDYDARLEQPGWDAPGFADASWSPAQVCVGPGGGLVSQMAPPIRVIQQLEPVRMTTPRPGITVYDLGQNFSGIPWIQVQGPRDSWIRITPAELITDEGLADQSASGGPHYYTYTLKGEGVETWHPRFTYYGFRYLQIECGPAENPPKLQRILGLFTRHAADRAGDFACSDELYNQIHELIDWSVGSNLQSVLTDCPHREKLGWLEVAHLMAPSILFNYDVPLFYTKVIRDTRDSQLPNGLVPDIAPEYTVFSAGFRDSPEWGSAAVILPWYVYQWFGDERPLRDSYDTMKRYVAYLASRAEDHIVSHGLGDWFDYTRGGEVGESRLTPKSLTATAMYYYDTAILRDAAQLLGKEEDTAKYARLAEVIRQSFNKHLFHPDTNQYATGSQTANAIPLVWGLVDGERFGAVLENLVLEVKQRDYLTSGDVGFRFLLRALADNGRSDLVYQLTHRTDEPGYGCQIQQGATSLTEAWDGRKVVSHNHCMLGHLQEWFHQELLGIRRDPAAPGFHKIIIQPWPVGEIAWVKGHYDSPYGRIACEWQRTDDSFTLHVEIPANTTAVIHVPTSGAARITESGRPAAEVKELTLLATENGYASFKTGSGKYVFVSPIQSKNTSGM